MSRPKYCPCKNERPDPCPACGATVEGNDAVHGVCQAINQYGPPEEYLSLVLLDKESGEIVASVGAYR